MKVKKVTNSSGTNSITEAANLTCYGAKTDGRTICFGAMRNGKYNILAVVNSFVVGGSQVCFKTIEEFEDFKSKYGDVQLMRRTLKGEDANLVQVETDYGPVWMKPTYYAFKSTNDNRKAVSNIVHRIERALSSVFGSCYARRAMMIKLGDERQRVADVATQAGGTLEVFDITKYPKVKLDVVVYFPGADRADVAESIVPELNKAVGFEALKKDVFVSASVDRVQLNVSYGGEQFEAVYADLVSDMKQYIHDMTPTVDNIQMWQHAVDKVIKDNL